MSKKIEFEYGDKEYTMEYTRETIQTMERRGFVVGDLKDKPITTLPELFAGAFMSHHPRMKPVLLDEIFSKFKDKTALLGALAEMYNEPLEELMDEPEEDSKNVTWEKNWR